MAKTPSKAPSKSADDVKLVRALAKVLNDTDLTEIAYKTEDVKIVVKRGGDTPVMVAAAPSAAPQAAPAPANTSAAPSAPADAPAGDTANAQTSPMVGTVYLRPSPDADAFIEVGAKVSAGDTLMLVEAMKTFNPITAEKSGTVSAIHVEDGQGVEFGDPLVTLT